MLTFRWPPAGLHPRLSTLKFYCRCSRAVQTPCSMRHIAILTYYSSGWRTYQILDHQTGYLAWHEGIDSCNPFCLVLLLISLKAWSINPSIFFPHPLTHPQRYIQNLPLHSLLLIIPHLPLRYHPAHRYTVGQLQRHHHPNLKEL